MVIEVVWEEETNEYDGYAIIRGYEVENYREWDEEDMSEIKNNNAAEYLDKLPLDRMNNMYACLSELKSKKLLAIFDESSDESYLVGRMVSLTETEVELKLINEEGEWTENEKIELSEITYIGFDTSYEKELLDLNAALAV